MENEILSVSDFHALINQTLNFAYPAVVIEGEVSSFKINQGKWVFFDLKDTESVISCFMTKYQLQTALEDGMLVRVTAVPNLTKWGKFSLTVRNVELAGEGAVKRAFELLKAQFEKEGLFAPERKRTMPQYPQRIALITSAQAAAYNDFLAIVNDRWSGLTITQAQVQVQGVSAPAQITRAIEFFSQHRQDYDVLVIIRGGGSAEDLQAFNAEEVVRAVYAATVPTIVGIGHEDDVSLAELAADLRAATPTDAARRLIPDKAELLRVLDTLQNQYISRLLTILSAQYHRIDQFHYTFSVLYGRLHTRLQRASQRLNEQMTQQYRTASQKLVTLSRVLATLDPQAILSRGYAIATIGGRVVKDADDVRPSDTIMLQLHKGRLNVRRGDNAPKRQRNRKGNDDDKDIQTRIII